MHISIRYYYISFVNVSAADLVTISDINKAVKIKTNIAIASFLHAMHIVHTSKKMKRPYKI